ncbi:MAG: DUF1499 domain-containing protein [Planctomycetota bacterium]|jgi:uncharacterized protein (DUF1499 family)
MCPGARLLPCPDRPNCVSSQAQDPRRRVEPLRYSGPADAALARLLSLLEAWPRTRIVSSEGGRVHAEVRTALLRFTDDVDFLLDESTGVIHVRSASRLGWSDMGTNRRRVEALRASWESAGGTGARTR